jgi:hypothetical protein
MKIVIHNRADIQPILEESDGKQISGHFSKHINYV